MVFPLLALSGFWILCSGPLKAMEPFEEKSPQNKQSRELIVPLVETQFVIDLGSSGVKLSGFRINMEKQIIEEEVFNKKDRILLQGAIKNKFLPKDIQERTIQSILTLLSEANVDPEKTKVIGFATAWARDANNSSEFLNAIKERTKVTLKIIDQAIEGKIGFHSTLAALRLLILNKDSFLYNAEEGQDLLRKISNNDGERHIVPESIISWDIGGGSMQLAKQDKRNKTVEVIGSTDCSTLFANAVIALKNIFPSEETKDSPMSTPNPLSPEQVEAAIQLSKEKAQQFIGSSFLECTKSQNAPVFGIGLMHQSNKLYVNTLLNKKCENYYLKSDLKAAVQLLINKNDGEIAEAIRIKKEDARNRFTSMLLVLGFMKHMKIDRVNTIDVNGFTGLFFTDGLDFSF